MRFKRFGDGCAGGTSAAKADQPCRFYVVAEATTHKDCVRL